ncbi:hypothetical protein Clacol_005645 [Clathrus columnatus]|uniref:Zinc finger ZPR1-type domain-containing protein n=1 Tax=Clathrus columnatus TaxID=1419009 RepID=A0AAV5ACT4_9AGAM|nr:hypothetical protein Clacol_005645 [Clathrus columnatus]
MSPENDKQDFFPAIGTLADKTDLLPEETDGQNATETADDVDRPLEEIESLCMSCGQQGITRMLLTKIPFFHEVIVMSFRCGSCGDSNNEIQPAGAVKDQGTIYTVRILNREDLNRQIVKSETSEIVIPEFEFTIPPHRGQLTTVEGLLRDAVKDLSVSQLLRSIQDPASYQKIQNILDKFQEIIADTDDEDEEEGKEDKPIIPFTIRLDDPAGNSFLEFHESMSDPKWNFRQYNRSQQQNVALGLIAPESPGEANKQASVSIKEPLALVDEMEAEEVFIFPGSCPSCRIPLETRMKKVTIPYFKDVLLMSTNCESCGYRDNEVKSGGNISEKGKKITLKVEDPDDLSRDILKSETCGLYVPEIDMALQPGTLGGRFTTVEGLLEQVFEELSEKVFSDSTTGDDAFVRFLGNLKEIKSGEKPFTLILDDPLANSYLQSLYAPDPDPNMIIELYDRTYEQDDELGLNDMKLEGYEEEHAAEMKRSDLAEEKDSKEININNDPSH